KRASRSSTSKKPGCFIFHHPQSTKGKWNHRADLNTRGFFEPSMLELKITPGLILEVVKDTMIFHNIFTKDSSVFRSFREKLLCLF
ncbi:hypothetical protein ABDK75_10370, partial [Gluconobacter sp. OJA]|uniref:hypothetical protein n=1 Tax=Gluconobacter sp. OJA TaxID=3145197 RepID=UPI0031F90475